jgi:hypothetical protein
MAGQSIDNEHRMVSWSPISALKEAIKAVPAMKYAVAVLGLVAVVAIAAAWRVNFKVAVFGAVIILILMVSVLLFARLTALRAGLFLVPAMILLYTFVTLTVGTGVLLFTAAAFKWPPALNELIFGPANVTPPIYVPPRPPPGPQGHGPRSLTLVASIWKVELGQKSTMLARKEFSSGAGVGVPATSLKEFSEWVSNQLKLTAHTVPVRIRVEKFAGPAKITERVCDELRANHLIQIVDPETVPEHGIDYIISGQARPQTP